MIFFKVFDMIGTYNKTGLSEIGSDETWVNYDGGDENDEYDENRSQSTFHIFIIFIIVPKYHCITTPEI